MIRAVLFDAAGTLIEPREPPGVTYANFARERGVDLPSWRVDDAYRRVIASAPPLARADVPASEIEARQRAWWRDVVRGTFLAADGTARFDDFDALFEALFRHFGSADAWALRPCARESLCALARRGLRLGIVSNFDPRLAPLARSLGLAPPIETVMLPADCGAWKPDPRIFRAALAALGVSAPEAAFVGDDPETDLAGARAAGLQALDLGTPPRLADLPARIEALATLDGASARDHPLRGGPR